MKKNVLWALMLAVGLVSCNNENEAPEVDVPTEGETTFLSVSLKAAGSMSRADVGSYEDGWIYDFDHIQLPDTYDKAAIYGYEYDSISENIIQLAYKTERFYDVVGCLATYIQSCEKEITPEQYYKIYKLFRKKRND